MIRILLLALTLAAPSLTWANVVFTLGNNPQPNEENVLLNNGTTGATVQGKTNQSGLVVNFTSGLQTLAEPSNGQARIEAINEGGQFPLADVSFSLGSGATFNDTIFNMFIGGIVGTPGGPAYIIATSNDGTFNFQTTLGNGSNFLTITTSEGEVLNSVRIFYGPGFTDLRQVRISGATAGNVPDSGATLPLLGVGILALAGLRRGFARA